MIVVKLVRFWCIEKLSAQATPVKERVMWDREMIHLL